MKPLDIYLNSKSELKKNQDARNNLNKIQDEKGINTSLNEILKVKLKTLKKVNNEDASNNNNVMAATLSNYKNVDEVDES